MMEIAYQPYIDPNYESLMERIHPPRCVSAPVLLLVCSFSCSLLNLDHIGTLGSVIIIQAMRVLR